MFHEHSTRHIKIAEIRLVYIYFNTLETNVGLLKCACPPCETSGCAAVRMRPPYDQIISSLESAPVGDSAYESLPLDTRI